MRFNKSIRFSHNGDYQELLELSVIFLGGIPPKGIKFHIPGAVHRARWMAKAIYCIKMCLFGDQYLEVYGKKQGLRHSYVKNLSNHVHRISLFVTTLYIKYWYTCPLSCSAPNNDLNFLKDLEKYHDKEVAQAALNAISRHLWYLSEILIECSFLIMIYTC